MTRATGAAAAQARASQRTKTVILLALAGGLSRRAAAARAGTSYRQFTRWLVADEPFAENVEIASGQGRAMFEDIIAKAAEKDWRAAAWAMEQQYLGGPRAKGSLDVALPYYGDEADVSWTPEQVEARVGRVMTILHRALGSDEDTTEAVVVTAALRLDE